MGVSSVRLSAPSGPAPKGPMRAFGLVALTAPLLVGLVSCGASEGSGAPLEPPASTVDQAFASAHGVLLDFEFDGQLASDSASPATLKSQISQQLMYTVGQLNGDSSVGRFERLELTNVIATPSATTGFDVTYHAKLPVAWGRPSAIPATYALKVPLTMTAVGLDTWIAAHNTTCVEPEGNGSDRYSYWYFYRPAAAGCVLAATDTALVSATVTRSPENTVGKYPEYDKVWSDGELNVVAMFGRYESGATLDTDPGIRDYNSFVTQARQYVRSMQPDATKIVETPGLTTTPGVTLPQVTLSATLPLLPGELSPRKLNVNVMLVGYRIYQDGATFDTWYDALTPKADLVLYAGHAGLGENVRTLMGKGVIGSGQYTIWMVNGCDTFAYVDPTLANRVSAANGGASPTLWLDTVSNAMPSYFSRTPNGSMTMIRGLMSVTAPKTYPQIFSAIDPSQIVVVTGEEDNLFDPSMPVVPGLPPGGSADAGIDSGPILPDASPPTKDAGAKDSGPLSPQDGGPVIPADAGPPPASTTPPTTTSSPPPVQAPNAPSPTDTGCACEAAPGHTQSTSSAGLAAFGLVAMMGTLVARRRRN